LPECRFFQKGYRIMDKSLFEELIEISWRRKLTPEEEVQLQSWMASHPADAERWEAETGLNQALDRLKPIQPSSNFTSQVLRLVELEQVQRSRRTSPSFAGRLAQLFGLRARGLVWATLAILVAGIGYYQYRENAHHQIAQGVHAFSTVATITEPEVLQDFEAVREFSQVLADVNPTDEALFVLLGQ
jgi:hypothetical protein